jgi:hypothetical protein
MSRIKASEGSQKFPVLTPADGEAIDAHKASHGPNGIGVEWTVTLPDGTRAKMLAKGITSAKAKRRANNITRAFVGLFREIDTDARPTVTAVAVVLNKASAPKGARSVALLPAADAVAVLLTTDLATYLSAHNA